MPAFRGKDVEVSFAGVIISGDGRSISYTESAETHDETGYGDDNRNKLPGLIDGSGTFESMDVSGDWSTAWEAIDPGLSDTMIIYPEGNSTGERSKTFTAVITERSHEMPYDDIATFSLSFEISGAVTEGVVP